MNTRLLLCEVSLTLDKRCGPSWRVDEEHAGGFSEGRTPKVPEAPPQRNARQRSQAHNDARSRHSRDVLTACRKEIVVFLTACRKGDRANSPFPLTRPSHLEGATLSDCPVGLQQPQPGESAWGNLCLDIDSNHVTSFNIRICPVSFSIVL